MDAKPDKEIFVPFTLHTEYWDNDVDYLIFDRVYWDKLEEHHIGYKKVLKLPQYVSKLNIDEIDAFSNCIVNELGSILNEYHNDSHDIIYWHRQMFYWVASFTTTIFYITEKLENIRRYFHSQKLYSRCYMIDIVTLLSTEDFLQPPFTDAYNQYMFGLLAEKYFNFTILYEKELKKKENVSTRSDTIYRYKRNYFRKLFYKYYCTKSNRAEVMFWDEDIAQYEIETLVIKSRGKIQPLLYNLNKTNKVVNIDIEIRKKIREELETKLEDVKWKKIVEEIIADFIPFYYIENYKRMKVAADAFFAIHPNLKVLKTITGCISLSDEKFLASEAQVRDIKVIGEEHAYGYGVVKGLFNIESQLYDEFWIWGKWNKDNKKYSLMLKSAPTYKFQYDELVTSETRDTILYGSDCVFVHDNYVVKLYNKETAEKFIERQVEFLSMLSTQVRKVLIVREHYKHLGWNPMKEVKKRFGDEIHFSKSNDEYIGTNFVKRDFSFAQDLAHAKLLIVDTCTSMWAEAMHMNIPVIVLISPGKFEIERTEEKYIQMMKNSGLLFDDVQKATDLINQIYDDPLSWWNEKKRAETVEILRERYLTNVENIDLWMTQTFMQWVD